MAPRTDPEGAVARIGIFGGTFDPPHVGHVTVAADVADELGLDRVLWVPAGRPPHKEGSALSPAGLRLEMVEAACRADPRFEASSVEIDRPGPSYTVDTLHALRPELGGADLFVIVGADQYRSFDSWRAPDEILRLARLAVMDRAGASARAIVPEAVVRAGRPGSGAEEAAGRREGGPAVFVPVTRIDVSATQVREAVRSGRDVSDLVTEGVLRVIERAGLYAR